MVILTNLLNEQMPYFRKSHLVCNLNIWLRIFHYCLVVPSSHFQSKQGSIKPKNYQLNFQHKQKQNQGNPHSTNMNDIMLDICLNHLLMQFDFHISIFANVSNKFLGSFHEEKHYQDKFRFHNYYILKDMLHYRIVI